MIAFNLQRPSSNPLNGPNSGCGANRPNWAGLAMSASLSYQEDIYLG
jgi:hypothetical protein